MFAKSLLNYLIDPFGENKLVLDQQVRELHGFRESEKTLAEEESKLMQAGWEAERAESKKVDMLRHQVSPAPTALRHPRRRAPLPSRLFA